MSITHGDGHVLAVVEVSTGAVGAREHRVRISGVSVSGKVRRNPHASIREREPQREDFLQHYLINSTAATKPARMSSPGKRMVAKTTMARSVTFSAS